MAPVEIKDFSHVIMCAFQKEAKDRLFFGEIWGLCEAAAPNLEKMATPEADRTTFVRLMLAAVDYLESADLINKHTKDAGEKLAHITLTTEGDQYIVDTIFAGQSRMGVVKPPPPRPPAFSQGQKRNYRNPQYPRNW